MSTEDGLGTCTLLLDEMDFFLLYPGVFLFFWLEAVVENGHFSFPSWIGSNLEALEGICVKMF